MSYLDGGHTLRSWFFTTDHKRIAILYAVAISFFFFIGGAAATVIRLELATPAADLVSHDTYNRLFTAHGIIMVWLFLIPSIPSVMGNFLVPLMIGARDLAFPRLNLASWYIYIAGGVVVLISLALGGIDTGWTFYTPYSTMFSNSWVAVALTGVFIVGFSSILTGLNFIVTVHQLRTPGMTWFKLPLFVWAIYATSLILVLATPVLAITVFLVIAERLWQIGVFDPAYGGDPLLFQHMFWFYSHPAVYIMVLPAMGVVSEIIPCFARQRIFGYRFMAYAILGIATIGFLVWGHHMFVSGQSLAASMVFSLLSFLVA
ncbi:MAG TPA: cbb3-type cytochrome c oxidase subunit I, partial [Ramlibacter sp.]|nr:cbb3-type cytochrome c oxidase subunit I [Ramlibacter sp.]